MLRSVWPGFACSCKVLAVILAAALAFAIVQDGRVVEIRNPDAVFRMASLSKVVTAYAVVKSGADLHADTGHGVTLHHLLTHTSGIEDAFFGNTVPVSEQVTLADHFRERPPRFGRAPGDAVVYSNEGMTLAGHLAANGPFEEWIAKTVFAPLGMTRSSFEQPPPFPVIASGAEGERLVQAPAGAMVSTASDMARLLIALLSDDSAAKSMRANRYGLFEYGGAFFHTGRSGHESVLYLNPEKRLGIFLVHTGGLDRNLRTNFVRDRGGWTPPAPTNPRIESGTYRPLLFPVHRIERIANLGADAAVRINGDRITLRLPPLAMGKTLTFDRGLTADGYVVRGNGDRFTITGPLFEPVTFVRVPAYASGRVQLIVAFSLFVAIVIAAFRDRLFATVAILFLLAPVMFFASYLPRSAEVRPFVVESSVKMAVAVLVTASAFALTTPLLRRRPVHTAAAVMLGVWTLWWVL